MRKKIYLINGPNLDMLGFRDPKLYGKLTLKDLEKTLTIYANEKGFDLLCFQSNSEGKLIDIIHESKDNAFAIIINAGAYTHYSYAIRDAIECSCSNTIEVHLTNIEEREDFRKISVIRPVCKKTFMGKGLNSYLEALDYISTI